MVMADFHVHSRQLGTINYWRASSYDLLPQGGERYHCF
jgi:hypothetical protein